MLGSIREALMPVSAALAHDGYMRRGTNIWGVRLNPQSSVRPARAGQSGRSYDAKFRFHNDGRVKPMQNDQVSLDGVNWWVVWRILPSPLETHAFLECMALPGDIVLPILATRVSDGMGGYVTVEQDDPANAFAASLSSASTHQLLTTQTEAQMNRLGIGYWIDDATIVPSMRLRVRGESYTVLAVTPDDENAAWGRAVLARED